MLKNWIEKRAISRRSALLGSSAAVAAAMTSTACTQTTQAQSGGGMAAGAHAGHGMGSGLANVGHNHPGELGSRMAADGGQLRAALADAAAADALPTPPVIRVAPGTTRPLGMRLQSCTVGTRQAKNLRTYDNVSARQYLMAPTLEFGQNGTYGVLLVNSLPLNPDQALPHIVNIPNQFNTTNLHTHGLHVSPSGRGDNVYLEILPAGTDRKYADNTTSFVGQFNHSYALSNHTPGTFWYHPHRHGSVAVQVASGAAGALIVRGGPGTVDAVPGIAGVTEQVLLLQQVMLDKNGELPDFDTIWGSPQNGASASWTVNGTIGRTLTMQPGEVQRWRIVNTGFQSTVKFQLADVSGATPAPLNVTLFAMDGVNFTKTATVQGVYLPPGGRADILVQAPAKETKLQALIGGYTKKDSTTGKFIGVTAGFEIGGVWQEADFTSAPTTLFQVNVTGPAKPMTLPSGALPAPNVPNITAATKPDGYRYVNFNVVTVTNPTNPPSNGLPSYRPDASPQSIKFQVDAELFCPGRVMFQPPLGTVDQYYVDSPGLHVFHIHVNPFLVTEVAGQTLSTPMWRDTMLAGPQGYKALTQYTDYSGTFPIHCHILDHEDVGMMTNVTVVDPANKTGSFPKHSH